MSVELQGGNCPKCGNVTMSLAGPNWMRLPTPATPGWVVIAPVCPNPSCKTILGTYAIPDRSEFNMLKKDLEELSGEVQRLRRELSR